MKQQEKEFNRSNTLGGKNPWFEDELGSGADYDYSRKNIHD